MTHHCFFTASLIPIEDQGHEFSTSHIYLLCENTHPFIIFLSIPCRNVTRDSPLNLVLISIWKSEWCRCRQISFHKVPASYIALLQINLRMKSKFILYCNGLAQHLYLVSRGNDIISLQVKNLSYMPCYSSWTVLMEWSINHFVSIVYSLFPTQSSILNLTVRHDKVLFLGNRIPIISWSQLTKNFFELAWLQTTPV